VPVYEKVVSYSNHIWCCRYGRKVGGGGGEGGGSDGIIPAIIRSFTIVG
jgi:hypothetical protein